MTLPHDFKFCHRCATPLVLAHMGGHHRPRCPACGLVVYLDPKVVAAAVVALDGRVLLVQRNMEPGIGLWALPAGHVDRGEVVEDAVRREVLEETGLRVSAGSLVGLYSEAGQQVILAAFDVNLLGGVPKPDEVEVRDVRFFPLDELPALAFPRDRVVIQDWRRLRASRQRSPADTDSV